MKSMADKVIDLENRSRRNNLRLVGLPEKEEGSDACAFLEKFLPETLELGESVTPLIIERAHRIPSSAQKNRQDGKVQPRTVIMKFLNFKQKETCSKGCKEKGVIAYKGSNLRFFSGFVGRASQGTTKVRCCPSKIAWQRNHPTQSNLSCSIASYTWRSYCDYEQSRRSGEIYTAGRGQVN